MNKDIESLPIFPKYATKGEGDKIYTFETHVHIHIDLEFSVKVYLYPVIGTYVARNHTERQLVIQAHLKECLRISKYGIFSPEDTLVLPFVEVLDKEDNQFLQKLHYMCP